MLTSLKGAVGLGLGWALTAVLSAQPCRAAPVTVPLVPTTAQVALTVYAMGLWPLPGRFERFSGNLVVDDAAAGHCQVTLDVEVGSLKMSDAARTGMALGPKLLDAAHFPALRYSGTCTTNASTGILTLHGVSRPLVLTTHWAGDDVAASGTIRRGDYGIDGMPGLIGRRVEVRLSVALPRGLAARLSPG